MNDPVETSELLAFTRAVEAKSLSRAAAELRVPRATISRRLARLEERLGVRLLRRTTRNLTLTDAGEAFYRHSRIVLDAVRQAEGSVQRSGDAVRGALRVSVPPMLDATFNEMICDFSKQHPDVQIYLHASTQYVDLQRDGYDVALRAGLQLEPGLVARTLAHGAVIAVASPEYLAEKGVPRTPRELRDHRCLLGFARGEVPQTHWPLTSGGKLRVEGSFFSNDLTLLCGAAAHGLGIAVLPALVALPLLRSGELVQVLPGLVGADSRIAIVYLERELLPPQVRAFIDAVVAWAPGRLGEEIPLPGPRRRIQRRPTRSSSSA